MTTPEISVVINTLNEEQNLPFALRSVVAWATDIVVVDMHSDDATREIAAAYGARVFLHEPLGFPDPAREFAIAQSRCPWVLILDADELVPKGLYHALCRVVADNRADVVRIPRVNYMFGAAIEYTGWHPFEDKQPRFFRKGALHTTHEIHRFLKPVPEARVVSMPYVKGEALVHFNYVTISHFIEKLNRYTSIEAAQDLERGRTVSAVGALWLALREWIKRYIIKQGFRDGWRGFYLAALMAFYRIAIAAKIREMRRAGTGKEITHAYAQLAESMVGEYGEKALPRAAGNAVQSSEP
jgi:(heptosyl)LPS beta-1,4-glucosyltransferase